MSFSCDLGYTIHPRDVPSTTSQHTNEVVELIEYVTLTCCQSRHSRLVLLSKDRAFTLEKYGLSRRKHFVLQRSFLFGMDH